VVEVVGRYDDSLGVSDAASQGVVTRQGIEKRPLLRAGEVVEAVPGMIVTQHSGDGKANQFFLRGYNLDHGTDFATWVAGMPLNMPTHAQRPGLHRPQLRPSPSSSRASRTQGPVFRRGRRFSPRRAPRA
jgi:hypothetical protein